MLKDARKKLGLTQRELGVKLGYNTPTAQIMVSMWESGKTSVPRDKIIEVSKLLNIPIENLI